jgi:hypothetical protein
MSKFVNIFMISVVSNNTKALDLAICFPVDSMHGSDLNS